MNNSEHSLSDFPLFMPGKTFKVRYSPPWLPLQAMTTATAMAAYPGGKQPYYPSPAVTLTFPMAPGTAALSSTYMCGGGCGGGGGTMTLTHPPPTINNYYLDSALDSLYREDGIVSPVSP